MEAMFLVPETAFAPETFPPALSAPHMRSARNTLSVQVLATTPAAIISPLVMADRLLTLAQDADRGGLHGTAQKLVQLACAVCDETPRR